ncbi:MAG: EAL domain-containing protein [Acidimicrobiales bacterium]
MLTRRRKQSNTTRRRQWGSDRRTQPLPKVPPPVSERRVTIGRLAIVTTVGAWFAYVAITIVEQFVEGRASSARLGIEAIVYLLVVTALTASAMAYLITRIGFFYRNRSHQRAPRAVIDAFYTETVPTVTVLVPSYQEDERVIRTTLLSAALQEHPHLRVVLLIDDPPQPRNIAAHRLLEAARGLPERIADELAEPLDHVRGGLERFESLQVGSRRTTPDDMVELASHYEFASQWLRKLGDRHEIIDHADTFFVEHVIGALAEDLETIARALRSGAEEGASLSTDRIMQLYRRLVSTFRAEMSSFERKRYVSCSHAANKAMNLNSYIALMGGNWQEVATPQGLALVPCNTRDADFAVPDPDYILTLDADSVLLPEYCARILYVLEQGGNADVAVAQTPYSAYPGAGTRIERIAGATTDLQHIVHQGMTHYDATFWVGANAILRKEALDDIVEIDHEDKWEIRRYIQDRTVIEDTESTIDLGVHGWTLFNYPERLAYSATPPDFGSLCIQRQRWANGGLLILSKLRDQSRARRERREKNRFGEVFLRVNYMASIFWASLCLLILLIYPFNSGLLKPILPLIALPYFLMMASDLRYCGYKRLDVLRIYGFNLILLFVNLAGAFASVLQLVTGEKSSFKRTPKVRDRTTARAFYILSPWLLIVFSAYWVVYDIQHSHWAHLFFAGLNATLALYAMVAFVGTRNSVVDLWVQLRGWLYQPAPPGTVSKSSRSADRLSPGAIGDWASVLHYGPAGSGARVFEARSTGAGVAVEANGAGRFAPQPLSDGRSPTQPAAAAFEEYTFFTVFQPIVDMGDDQPVGYEALTRFADGQSPQESLAQATSAGLGLELDMALIHAAMASARALPVGAWLAVNVSPGLAAEPDKLAGILSQAPCPVVVEVPDTAGAEDLVRPLRQIPGVMVAIDDAGAGYESLSRIERLQPEFMKLQRDAVTGLADDAARQVFVETLVEFAERHGCQVIAEGIETEPELETLRQCGVHLGQGYLVGRPVPVSRVSERVVSS